MTKAEFYRWAELHVEEMPKSVQTLLLAAGDNIIIDPQIPTSATAYLKGIVTLLLGKMFIEGDTHARVHIMQHEAGHLALGHLGRMQARNPLLWNLVVDASLHKNHICHEDWDGAVTFERLGIAAMPPEIAYDLLMKNAPPQAGQSCGSCLHSHHDSSMETRLKWAELAATLNKQLELGLKGSLTGQAAPSALPDVAYPAWMRQVIQMLVLSVRRATQRRRSWMREHRGLPTMLPGMTSGYNRTALFLVDASGSISHETLAIFVRAVVDTPELAGSDVAVFAHGTSEPAPVGVHVVQEMLKEWQGGGTNFEPPAALRQETLPTVWLTDGYPCGAWPHPMGTEIWVIAGDAEVPAGLTVVRTGGSNE